jgi:hypothetical protein
VAREGTALLVVALPVERVLPRTGHMFRFTHPVNYSRHIKEFMDTRVLSAASQTTTCQAGTTTTAGQRALSGR